MKPQERRLSFEWQCWNCSFCLPWQAERGTPESRCPRCHHENWRRNDHATAHLTDADVRAYWDKARKDYAGP